MARLLAPTSLALLIVAAACGDAAGPAPDTVASVALLRPDSATVWAGDTTRLTATARGADGAVLPAAPVTWTTSDAAVATVADGLVTARAAGRVTISATAGGREGRLALAIAGADLVFEGWPAGMPEAFAIDVAAGTRPARMFAAGATALDPTPSPDGTRVAYVVANYADGTGDIWVADRDGRNARRLTSDDELDDQPAWSPDGGRIAFRSFAAGHDGDVWVMNADGSAKTNLTPDPLPGITDEARPAWSPDGRFIAYTSNAAGFSRNIWRMNADGSDPRRLTSAATEVETEATWSPDGTRIAYRRATNGSDIVVMNADGSAQVRLDMPGIQRQPAWSPDGRRIAFVSQASISVRPELFTMRPDGTAVTSHLADATLGAGLEPAWRRRQAAP